MFSATGVPMPSGSLLDGVSRLAALGGEPATAPPERFWRWNRYLPVVESEAAARFGEWKLIVRAIREVSRVTGADGLVDQELKYYPERHFEVDLSYPPRRLLDEGPAPQLFNLALDPLDANDPAGAEPQRVSTTLDGLRAWLEQVEGERRSLPDAHVRS